MYIYAIIIGWVLEKVIRLLYILYLFLFVMINKMLLPLPLLPVKVVQTSNFVVS
jgi:hypothetical protein